MSFSTLSREVRDLIYQALLCPPDGVRLHLSQRHRWRKYVLFKNPFPGGIDSGKDKEGEGEEEKEDEEGVGDSERWGTNNSDAVAATPVPTAIFSVDRQIRQEATEIFYGFNRFTFDTSADITLTFLKGLRPSSRRRIKHIGFAGWSTCGDEEVFADLWHSLCRLIFHHMSLRSVTSECLGTLFTNRRDKGGQTGSTYRLVYVVSR